MLDIMLATTQIFDTATRKKFIKTVLTQWYEAVWRPCSAATDALSMLFSLKWHLEMYSKSREMSAREMSVSSTYVSS